MAVLAEPVAVTQVVFQSMTQFDHVACYHSNTVGCMVACKWLGKVQGRIGEVLEQRLF